MLQLFLSFLPRSAAAKNGYCMRGREVAARWIARAKRAIGAEICLKCAGLSWRRGLLDARHAVAPECPAPTADRPAMHPDSQRRFQVRRTPLNKKHCALAKSCLRPLIQFARIA
jgi:hypothetical protein